MKGEPIFSMEAEKSLLGCIAVGSGAPLDHLEIALDHFHHFANRTIAEAALSLHRNGSPVNAITILQAIPQAQIEKIGGHAYVLETCNYPSPSQAPHFLAILDDKLRLRKAQEINRWLSEEVTPDSEPDVICDGLRQRVGALETTSKSDNILPAAIANIRAALQELKSGPRSRGIEMPWKAWNGPFGGLNRGKMYVLAGRPGTGKTAMMEEMIAQIALTKGQPVLVFEKDMSPETLIERMVCRLVGVQHYRFEKGFLADVQIDKMQEALSIMQDLPIHLYSPAGLTAEKMCAITRREIRLHGIKAVFLDHIQVLKVSKDLREGLTQASLCIRECATSTGVPHVILAHLNREGAKSGRPKPEDIKEFDQLYGDCDAMALLWSSQKAEDLAPGVPLEVNLYAAKNRSGPTTEEPLNFDRPMMSFKDRPKKE